LGKQIPINSGDKILLPRSEIALPDLPEILRARGGIVNEINAYAVKTNPPDKLVLEGLVEKQIDVITFFSPSGILGIEEMLVEAGVKYTLVELLKPLTVACLGPTTEKTACQMGLRVDVVAREHTSNGLIRELERWRRHL
jgi:uroporphyrinogen III methyltransferase/synthase